MSMRSRPWQVQASRCSVPRVLQREDTIDDASDPGDRRETGAS
jgi:hypothetical protein